MFFFVLRLYFKDIVPKTDFYTFFSWFFVTSHLPNVEKAYVCNPKSALYWLHHDSEPYLTWILELAIFRRQKYIFCIFYIFNALYHLRGTFKDTFTLGFFLFWSSVSKIWSKKRTCTHFSADFFLPVHSLMLLGTMFEIPSLSGHDNKSYELRLFYL